MAVQPTNKARELLELIKFEHTVFAMPFALIGAWMAAGGWPPMDRLFWVVLAIAGGRTYAMALNRILDRVFDARNPRTAQRALPAGRIKLAEAWALGLGGLAVFILGTLQLPPLCMRLWPLAFLVLTVYSLMKRISWACHLVLGLALGAAAAGGWVAVSGTLPVPAMILGLTVFTWAAGFDIIYACQDVDIDRAEGLHSIPARLGLRGGLRVSSFLHVLTVAGLVALGVQMGMGVAYWVGVATVLGCLVHEHRLVSADDLSRVDAAFFTLNGCVSLAMFTATVLDYALSAVNLP
ncbi:MAG: UbiA family prenyltransferase [Candidatus Sericytochromatia bacterium]|nr:UbiA family prenyltransferase [Candidatus Sericytochromatia bacterium]